MEMIPVREVISDAIITETEVMILDMNVSPVGTSRSEYSVNIHA